jgi:hypothetical protein
MRLHFALAWIGKGSLYIDNRLVSYMKRLKAEAEKEAE